MLVIRAVSFNGKPVTPERSARFGDAGGTIGRGDNSTLVLPDPERFISRTHATISFQAGGFVITDNSTKNPIVLNGQAMGPGAQTRLGDGDRVQIGGYTLQVSVVASTAQQIPPIEIGLPRPSASTKNDPKNPADKSGDPFADLLKPSARTGPRPEPVAPPSSPHPPSQDPLAGLRRPDARIDDLLDLRPRHIPELSPSEFRPAGPGGQPAKPDVVDPLEALGGAPRRMPPPTVPDQAQEVSTPYVPPVAKLDPQLAPRATPAPPSSTPSIAPPPIQPADPVATSATESTLLRALLRGAGIQDLPQLHSLTPDMMEAMGALLREAVQGTIDLLRARGLTKSEMRADVTMIMPMDNNPLKFSPSVEAALGHLIAPHVPGFMPPLRAMKNAYDDLRAHQLGVLAGMRAALDEVLGRFAPEELRRRLSDPSVLDSLLPVNRKAKQWDLFVERYQAVADEAREDFNAMFGKAFLRAYEAQIKQLRAGER